MRILSFTGGAGAMYCGSCLRDNALAAALLARGHDVVLTPVYTPTRTDERNVSQAQVFFGGISVFLEQQVPLFRHTPRVFDRIWDAPWVIRLATKRQIKVDPASLGEPLRQAIASFDPDQPLYDVRTMAEVWEADLQGSRLLIRVMSALALIALGLAGLGVWGVAAQSVGQRTREIGVRVALGANASQVGRLIAWQGFLPVAVGLAIGLAAGLGLGRLMRSILFQVTPTDSVTVVGTLMLLAVVGLVATLGPALRAARLDPLVALRTE